MTAATARRERRRPHRGDKGSALDHLDHLGRVNEKIAAAVAEAPPLPEGLAARLVDLIRATPTPGQRAA